MMFLTDIFGFDVVLVFKKAVGFSAAVTIRGTLNVALTWQLSVVECSGRSRTKNNIEVWETSTL